MENSIANYIDYIMGTLVFVFCIITLTVIVRQGNDISDKVSSRMSDREVISDNGVEFTSSNDLSGEEVIHSIISCDKDCTIYVVKQNGQEYNISSQMTGEQSTIEYAKYTDRSVLNTWINTGSSYHKTYDLDENGAIQTIRYTEK